MKKSFGSSDAEHLRIARNNERAVKEQMEAARLSLKKGNCRFAVAQAYDAAAHASLMASHYRAAGADPHITLYVIAKGLTSKIGDVCIRDRVLHSNLHGAGKKRRR